MKIYKDLSVHYFQTKLAFSEWMQNNFSQSEAVWLKFAKKESGVASLTYEEARDVALCYGWIDGQKNALDKVFYLIKFSPRRPRSTWSKINRKIAENLIKTKQMEPSGISEVERAKVDGRWKAAYDSPTDMTVPDWFIRQIQKNKRAYGFYKTLNKANLYSVAYHLRTAKKQETIMRRAEKYIRMFEDGEKIH